MDEAIVRDVVPQDWPPIMGLDASYETDRTLRAELEQDGSLRLSAKPLGERQARSFTIDLTADEWTRGWVIECGGKLVGFLGTQYAQWNRRLIIWHFYVDLSQRRKGFGRRLLDRALAEGQGLRADSVWVETSNYNAPGIAAYRKLGFELCGYDQSLYSGTGRSSEFAVFLCKRLTQ